MLLVLILLGHNGMLTVKASPDRGTIVATVTTVNSDDRDHAPSHIQHSSPPDVDCGISANVATLQSSGFATQLVSSALIDAAALPSIGSNGDSSPEPTTPPSVRRALLQVYRI